MLGINKMPVLTEVLAKDPALLTEEEKAFLREHADILSDEEKAKFKDVIPEFATPTPAEGEAPAEGGETPTPPPPGTP